MVVIVYGVWEVWELFYCVCKKYSSVGIGSFRIRLVMVFEL